MADYTNDFDKRVDAVRKHLGGVDHGGTLDAAIYVRDTLEIALLAAKSVDATATFDHALAVYDRIEIERARHADSESE